MDKVKNLAKVAIVIGLLDFMLKAFGSFYTIGPHNIDLSPFTVFVPILAIISGFGLMKAKKWGMWVSVILALLSILATFGVVKNGITSSADVLPIIYLIVFGLLTFWSFQESKNLS